MEFVRETPVKRRKLSAPPFAESQPYNSQDDSGDDLFADFETVATLPVTQKPSTRNALDMLSSSPPYITQPTQVIDRAGRIPETPEPRSSAVQVVASSPLNSPSVSRLPLGKGGILASSMAPPGTAFQLPFGVTKRSAVLEISDDDENQIQYQGGSSDEESQVASHIKPSKFTARSQALSKLRDAQNKKLSPPADGIQKFKEITSKSFYKPLDKRKGSGLTGSVFDSRNRDESNTSSVISAPKRSADTMANAYGGSSRPVKLIRQTGPAKAMPVPQTMYNTTDDIEDDGIRRKVIRMQTIIGGYSVDVCYGVLALKKGNVEDALEYMTTFEDGPIHIDLTSSPARSVSYGLSSPPQPTAKQQVRASQTIQEKYASTLQGVPRNTQVVDISSSVPPKPRRRLVKGRKNRSSPVPSLPRTPVPLSREISPESVDSTDSAIEIEPEDDVELESDLLNFFNTCSLQDLADIATITEDLAALVITNRPFQSLEDVRQVSTEPTPATATKRAKTKRPVGEKIVNTCETMWTGYEAVDKLVEQCKTIGKPLTEEMQRWGLDVFGIAKEGELELVSFDNLQTEDRDTRLRDSGIGTPAISGDEDDVIKGSRGRGGPKVPFFPQPSIMAPGVTLKDYQVVGINWLSLMFDNKLSCILADDMGLGKTCQVIAFLASLFEKGIMGPHVVIVPGSTLENWLREFQAFCPVLNVMPYYGMQLNISHV
jgi:SWI/SNF-related matrix-associated actin-dependent regulator 1 of chromatin subfamily A